MLHHFSRSLFLLIAIICVSDSKNVTFIKQLLESIFIDYDRDMMPFYDRSMVIPTYFVPMSIRELDEVSGTFTIIAAISTRWEDPRIQWNPEQYNGTKDLKIKSSKIWYPEIYCLNTADKMATLGEGSFIAYLHHRGIVTQTIGIISKTTCDVDMTYFPFDVQMCPILITAWGLSPEIKLKAESDAISLNYHTENPRWDIISVVAKNVNRLDVHGIIDIEFTIRRKPGYFVLSNIVPIILLMILNPLVFILPIDSGERLSYAVTILLSLAVFMTLVNDNMPKSANPISLLSYFLIIVMVYSTLQCIMVIVISAIYLKSSNVPEWLCPYSSCKKGRKRKTNPEEKDASEMQTKEPLHETVHVTWKDLALVLDRVSIVLFYCCHVAMLLAAMCPILITTWGLSPEIMMKAESDAISLNYHTENPRWDIISVVAKNVNRFSFRGLGVFKISYSLPSSLRKIYDRYIGEYSYTIMSRTVTYDWNYQTTEHVPSRVEVTGCDIDVVVACKQ